MKNELQAGDLVLNLSGRNKGAVFLIVKTEGGYAYIADGRKRKIANLKKKNLKHLGLIVQGALKGEAELIAEGKCFGNDRLKSLISRHQN